MRISDWSSDVCSSDLTADRLAAGSPDEALVARLGGDEFVVCAAVRKVPEAVALAHRLAGLVSAPVRLPGGPHRVGISIGVALARQDDDADRLLRSADAALREAQRAGRGRGGALDAGRPAGLAAKRS